MNPGLYIHVPFCLRKCSYCDFYSGADLALVPLYLKALRREMALLAEEISFKGEIDTVYFGGGTPSLLEADDVKGVLGLAKDHFSLARDLEVTLETNPGTVDKAKLAAFQEAGVNRLNVGVQSLDDATLKFLGRLHGACEARGVLKDVRALGFENLGGDLIYGIPGQTQEAVLKDLKALLALDMDHLSCYMLTVEEGTPLSTLHARGDFSMPSEDLSGDLFIAVSDALTAQGYDHYEVSNFARGFRFRSRHNVKYWKGATTIALGPSAHSFLREKSKRWWNFSSTKAYAKALEEGRRPVSGCEVLGAEDRLTEAIYLGLRRSEGIDLAALSSLFSRNLSVLFKEVTQGLCREKLAVCAGPRLRLTRRGFSVADGVVMRLMSTL